MTLPPFQALVDAHGADLHRYLVVVAGRDGADDAFQDVMVAALRAYPSLRDARNLRGWLFTVAHNQAVDRHRARARRPAEVALVAAGAGPAGAPAPEPAADDAVWAAVAALPPKQRDAVVLRFVADLPYRDIVAIVGGTEAAARRNVHEALTRLRAEVNP